MRRDEHVAFVRRAEDPDLPVIAEVLLEARAGAAGLMPPLADSHADLRAHVVSWDLDSGRREVWVAETGGRVAGFAVVHEGWLDHLYVRPSAAGHGLGSMLLEAVKATSPQGFGLYVFEANAPARRFYHRHGLVEVEHADGSANAEGVADVRLAWLSPAPATLS